MARQSRPSSCAVEFSPKGLHQRISRQVTNLRCVRPSSVSTACSLTPCIPCSKREYEESQGQNRVLTQTVQHLQCNVAASESKNEGLTQQLHSSREKAAIQAADAQQQIQMLRHQLDNMRDAHAHQLHARDLELQTGDKQEVVALQGLCDKLSIEAQESDVYKQQCMMLRHQLDAAELSRTQLSTAKADLQKQLDIALSGNHITINSHQQLDALQQQLQQSAAEKAALKDPLSACKEQVVALTKEVACLQQTTSQLQQQLHQALAQQCSLQQQQQQRQCSHQHQQQQQQQCSHQRQQQQQQGSSTLQPETTHHPPCMVQQAPIPHQSASEQPTSNAIETANVTGDQHQQPSSQEQHSASWYKRKYQHVKRQLKLYQRNQQLLLQANSGAGMHKCKGVAVQTDLDMPHVLPNSLHAGNPMPIGSPASAAGAIPNQARSSAGPDRPGATKSKRSSSQGVKHRKALARVLSCLESPQKGHMTPVAACQPCSVSDQPETSHQRAPASTMHPASGIQTVEQQPASNQQPNPLQHQAGGCCPVTSTNEGVNHPDMMPLVEQGPQQKQVKAMLRKAIKTGTLVNTSTNTLQAPAGTAAVAAIHAADAGPSTTASHKLKQASVTLGPVGLGVAPALTATAGQGWRAVGKRGDAQANLKRMHAQTLSSHAANPGAGGDSDDSLDLLCMSQAPKKQKAQQKALPQQQQQQHSGQSIMSSCNQQQTSKTVVLQCTVFSSEDEADAVLKPQITAADQQLPRRRKGGREKYRSTKHNAVDSDIHQYNQQHVHDKRRSTHCQKAKPASDGACDSHLQGTVAIIGQQQTAKVLPLAVGQLQNAEQPNAHEQDMLQLQQLQGDSSCAGSDAAALQTDVHAIAGAAVVDNVASMPPPRLSHFSKADSIKHAAAAVQQPAAGTQTHIATAQLHTLCQPADRQAVGSSHHQPLPALHAQGMRPHGTMQADGVQQQDEQGAVYNGAPQRAVASEAPSSPEYKYTEVVRKVAIREQLQGAECAACKAFYEAMATWGAAPEGGRPTCGHAVQAAAGAAGKVMNVPVWR